MFTKKKILQVGVTITIDNRMEVIVVDTDTRKVLQYEQVEVGYNFQTKELADYLQFASTLRNVLDEMKLSMKDIEITITIPSIHFATAQVQSNHDDAEIRTILATYAQDFYLFKRHEPVIAYQLYPNGGREDVPVVYSALQETVIDNISDALLSVQIDNFSINNPYASVLNALAYLGKLDRQINSGEIWNFVQITNNGFTLFSMIGTTIREVNDMPLPLKTFSPEEIYESMALSLQNNLSIYPASSLFVISRTDLISAQQLLERMEIRGDVEYLENNTYLTEPIMDIGEKVDSDFAKLISVECIGSAITSSNSPLNLCFMTKKDLEDEVFGTWKFGNSEVTVNDTFVNYLLLGIIVLIGVIGGLACFLTSFINGNIESDISKLQSEKTKIEQEITKAKGENEGNVDTIILDISKNNKASVSYFNAISREIPSNIWLTYYMSDAKGALMIKGDTGNVESLYSFFNGLKNSVENSSISLSKLEYNDINAVLNAKENGNKSLTFEITSSSYNSGLENNTDKTEENTDDKKTDNTTQAPPSTPDTNTNNEGLPEPPAFEPPATN